MLADGVLDAERGGQGVGGLVQQSAEDVARAARRAKVPQRFVDVRYRGPAPDWTQLAPLELAESKDGQARLRVGRDTDLAAVVAAARDRADIVSFAYQPPTLSELFRQAVAA